MHTTILTSSRILLKVFGSVIPPPSQKGNWIICQNQIAGGSGTPDAEAMG